ASKKVTGYSGGGVLIKCKYNTEYTQNLKSFCKGSSPACSDKIKTKDKNMWVTSGRYSLFDDTKSAEFWVMIRELTVEDTGTYRCGDHWNVLMNNYTLELEIKKDKNIRSDWLWFADASYEKSISKTVYVGGELSIYCKYPEFLKSSPKFLCKRPNLAACLYTATVKESRRFLKVGKITMYDDRENQIFTVSIKHVTEQDSNEYWCGAEV
ncbi:polymeric immunoglobulin receptor-like isoform X1, partial [Silurus meridionalis]